jgi:hypothetical protein
MVGSTGRRASVYECSTWGFVAEGSPRPSVELEYDGVEFVLDMDGQVELIEKILAQQAAGVLVASTLPKATGVAEVDHDIGRHTETLVLNEFRPTAPGQL